MSFKPPQGTDTAARLKYMENFLAQLTEKTAYCLGHIDADNISADVALLQNDSSGSNTYDYQLQTINAKISTCNSNISTVVAAVLALTANVEGDERIHSGSAPVANTSGWALIWLSGEATDASSVVWGWTALVPLEYLRAGGTNTITVPCNTATGKETITLAISGDPETLTVTATNLTVGNVAAYGIIAKGE